VLTRGLGHDRSEYRLRGGGTLGVNIFEIEPQNDAPIPADRPFAIFIGSEGSHPVTLATAGGSYKASVFPGTYDLIFSNGNDGENVLPNSYSNTKFQSGIVVSASPLTLNVDIPAATVSGLVTLNGKRRGDWAHELNPAFSLQLSGSSSDTPVAGAVQSDGSYSSLLIPGTYELFYARDFGGELPSNQRADLGCFIVR